MAQEMDLGGRIPSALWKNNYVSRLTAKISCILSNTGPESAPQMALKISRHHCIAPLLTLVLLPCTSTGGQSAEFASFL